MVVEDCGGGLTCFRIVVFCGVKSFSRFVSVSLLYSVLFFAVRFVPVLLVLLVFMFSYLWGSLVSDQGH